jgi:hypothetical protein
VWVGFGVQFCNCCPHLGYAFHEEGLTSLVTIRFAVLPSSTYFFTVGVECLIFSRDRTQTHTTVGRTPLDGGSARRRDFYLTTQTLYKRQTPMPPVRFEPTIPASARPQTYVLDRAATGIGLITIQGLEFLPCCRQLKWTFRKSIFEEACLQADCFLTVAERRKQCRTFHRPLIFGPRNDKNTAVNGSCLVAILPLY